MSTMISKRLVEGILDALLTHPDAVSARDGWLFVSLHPTKGNYREVAPVMQAVAERAGVAMTYRGMEKTELPRIHSYHYSYYLSYDTDHSPEEACTALMDAARGAKENLETFRLRTRQCFDTPAREEVREQRLARREKIKLRRESGFYRD